MCTQQFHKFTKGGFSFDVIKNGFAWARLSVFRRLKKGTHFYPTYSLNEYFDFSEVGW